MTEISKEEMMMFLEVQSKSAAQMQLVAEQLKTISEIQKDIVSRLTNGLSSDIKSTKAMVAEIKDSSKSVREDIFQTKIIVGACSLVICVAIVVINFIDFVSEKTLIRTIASYEKKLQSVKE